LDNGRSFIDEFRSPFQSDRTIVDIFDGRLSVAEPGAAQADLKAPAVAIGGLTIEQDVSDGLVGDLMKLCAASCVGAEVEVGRIPFSDAASAALSAEPGLMETLLTGGDDYEVIFAINPDRLDSFRAATAATGVPIASIGRIVQGDSEPRR
jgi:thiamine-monophosphate kinase